MIERLEERDMLSVTAGDVSFNTSHDQPLVINAGGLFANSSTDSGNLLTSILVSNPSDGTLTDFGGDGSLTFTPAAGFVGAASFTFDVTDGIDTSDPVTATINVTDAPAVIQVGSLTDLTGDSLLRPFASFTDADNPGATFTTNIDYGDGSSDAGTVIADGQGGYFLESSHAYATAGTYTATVTITDPLGMSSSATFTVTIQDQYDNTYTDPDGNATQFVYAGNWQLVQEIDPLGGSTYYTYTTAGQLASKTDPLGREIEYGYDDNGNLTSEVWLNADGSTQDSQSFTYDDNGNMLTAANNNGTYAFTYNDQNQLTGVTEPFGVSMAFGYDANGNRTSITDSFGGTTTSVYNSDNQLTSRSFTDETNTLDVGLTYNSDGTLATIDRYSDLTGTNLVAATAYSYVNGQLATIAHTDANGNTIDAFDYSFDLNGLVTSASSTLGGASNYTYDSTGQLTGDGANTYSYDANGNRTMTGYSTGTDNELTSDGTWNYTYDAVGNTTGKTNIATGETWRYTYDNANHMTGAQQWTADPTVYGTGGAVLEMEAVYKYDVFANRIEKDVSTAATGTVVTRYVMDGFNNDKPNPTGNSSWDVWAQLDSDNNIVVRYVTGDGDNEAFARIDAAGVAWLLTDNLGSIRDVVSNAGALLDHIDYDGFGNTTYQLNPAHGGDLLYTGDQFDTETGLYFSRARYLEATMGRWTSQDPLGFAAGDANLYRYVSNSPTQYEDVSGMSLGDLWGWWTSPVDSWAMEVVDSQGRVYTPSTAQQLINTLITIRNNGATVTSLVISGHGGGDNIQVGSKFNHEFLSCVAGRVFITDPNNPNGNDLDITDLLRSVTGLNTVISFNGCYTSGLAANVQRALRTGAVAWGIYGYGVRIPGTNSALGIYLWDY